MSATGGVDAALKEVLATKGLAVTFSDEKGRCLAATRHFSRGTTVLLSITTLAAPPRDWHGISNFNAATGLTFREECFGCLPAQGLSLCCSERRVL